MDPNVDGSPPPLPPTPPAIVGSGAVVAEYKPFQAPPPPWEAFWAGHCRELERMVEAREYSIPLNPIKRIMKADQDVSIVAAEALALFARACELFVIHLTFRAWAHKHQNPPRDRRRWLRRVDVAAAIAGTDVFDFLLDVVQLPAPAPAPDPDPAPAPAPAPDPFGDYYVDP